MHDKDSGRNHIENNPVVSFRLDRYEGVEEHSDQYERCRPPLLPIPETDGRNATCGETCDDPQEYEVAVRQRCGWLCVGIVVAPSKNCDGEQNYGDDPDCNRNRFHQGVYGP